MRFFFHLSSRDDKILDNRGRELSDLAAAHRHAMLLIHKMVLLDDVDWRGWSISVSDETNRSILIVLFPQTSCLQSQGKSRQENRDIIG